MEKRCIYSYEFNDNHVYVGLTNNHKNRQYQHKKEKNSSVYKHNIICSAYTFKILTDYVDVKEAKIKEAEYVELYRNNKWIILNRTGTGSIGGTIVKWNYNKCKETALNYNNKSDLKKDYMGCYIRINREKWVELFDHMINLKLIWTKEKIISEALNYENYTDFRKSKAYRPAIIYNLLDIVCDLFDRDKTKHNYWTKEKCLEEALKYTHKVDFLKNSSSAYTSTVKNGWIEEHCSHMIELIKPRKYWTKEKCLEEASKYNTIIDFQKKSRGAYYACFLNNWVIDIPYHIKRMAPNTWTKDRCIEEAKKYDNKKIFRENCKGCYSQSYKKGWLDEICTHMKQNKNTHIIF